MGGRGCHQGVESDCRVAASSRQGSQLAPVAIDSGSTAGVADCQRRGAVQEAAIDLPATTQAFVRMRFCTGQCAGPREARPPDPADVPVGPGRRPPAHKRVEPCGPWLDWAQRKPLLSLRLPGSFLLRFEARRFGGLLFHDPPRGLPTACVGLHPHISRSKIFRSRYARRRPEIRIQTIRRQNQYKDLLGAAKTEVAVAPARLAPAAVRGAEARRIAVPRPPTQFIIA
jgi:hypothetical protein